ncbi:hypothetical protein K2Z83_20705 [Oscillochloris sp. ZM17-4]|uniref:hypothetical protein n=1 Tax=Oscillochloris sp. ZM17-4 TaxID=2866714 RepID=UPI001C732A99|nr:hypothetical protein [Oscillochloris sp. ZM17-4]MBX0330092.1 hypothetical protein [Oscillochloris sp. ZM17-4]
MQTIFFGVIDPLGEADAGVRGPRYEEIDGLCETFRQVHVGLEWRYEALVAVPLAPSEPKDIIGIKIAFALADISAGVITDLIDLRQLRGLTQALVDWQVVRLAAASLGIELGDGRLFIVQEEGAQHDA